MKRTLIAALALAAQTACQTAPRPQGFSSEQIAILEVNGFINDGDDWYLGMPDRLLFPIDGRDLDNDQRERLKQLSQTLTGIGLIGARLEGHSDSTGGADYNRRLSLLRAEVVKQALSEGGMNPANIETSGEGEDDPIENNDTAEGRRQNRRVVIIVSPANVGPPNPATLRK